MGDAAAATDPDDEAKKKKEEEEAAAKKKKEEEEEAKKPEPESFVMSNPCRVTHAQHPFVETDPSCRYRPVANTKSKRNLGVVVLTDTTPTEEDDELLEIEAPPKVGAEAEEPTCPEPFDWIPPEHKKQ